MAPLGHPGAEHPGSLSPLSQVREDDSDGREQVLFVRHLLQDLAEFRRSHLPRYWLIPLVCL